MQHVTDSTKRPTTHKQKRLFVVVFLAVRFFYQLGPRNSESSNEGSSHSDCALLHSPNSADVVNRFRRRCKKVPAQRCGTRSRADVIGSAAGDDLFLCAKFFPAATASASPRSAVASSTQPLERYVVSGAGAPAVDGEYVPASFLVFGLVYSPWMCG